MIRNLVILFVILLSVSAKADQASYEQFTNWVKQLGDVRAGQIVIPGTTPDDQTTCELVISESGDDFNIRLGVGRGFTSQGLSRNLFITSLVKPNGEVRISNDTIKLPDGRSSIHNGLTITTISEDLEIKLRPSGRPERVSGRTPFEPKLQVCIFDEPSVS